MHRQRNAQRVEPLNDPRAELLRKQRRIHIIRITLKTTDQYQHHQLIVNHPSLRSIRYQLLVATNCYLSNNSMEISTINGHKIYKCHRIRKMSNLWSTKTITTFGMCPMEIWTFIRNYWANRRIGRTMALNRDPSTFHQIGKWTPFTWPAIVSNFHWYISRLINFERRCTGIHNVQQECHRTASFFSILPPVVSAKFRTSKSFNFKYGKIEVRAKLPKGDWMFPGTTNLCLCVWKLPFHALIVARCRNLLGTKWDRLWIQSVRKWIAPDSIHQRQRIFDEQQCTNWWQHT